MAESHSIAVTRTARYFTLGTLAEPTRQVWFVMHGYGQLAEHFIRKFEVLAQDHVLIVAPEALSRFYTNGNYDRVGASWMTREERESEIDDYVAYLESIQKTIFKDRSPDDFHITVLGFSQGAATACRWLNRGRIRCNRLILWGGYFADGLMDLIDTDRLPRHTTHFVYGTQDEFLNRLDLPTYIATLQQEVPTLQVVEYTGGHTIVADVLVKHFADANRP